MSLSTRATARAASRLRPLQVMDNCWPVHGHHARLARLRDLRIPGPTALLGDKVLRGRCASAPCRSPVGAALGSVLTGPGVPGLPPELRTVAAGQALTPTHQLSCASRCLHWAAGSPVRALRPAGGALVGQLTYLFVLLVADVVDFVVVAGQLRFLVFQRVQLK